MQISNVNDSFAKFRNNAYIRNGVGCSSLKRLDGSPFTMGDKISEQLAIKNMIEKYSKGVRVFFSAAARPFKTTQWSKGYEILHCGDDVKIKAGELKEIDTNIKVSWLLDPNVGAMIVGDPSDIVTGVYVEAPTIVSPDNFKTLKVYLRNKTTETIEVSPGQRLARLVFLTDKDISWIETSDYFFYRLSDNLRFIESFKGAYVNSWEEHERTYGMEYPPKVIDGQKAVFYWETGEEMMGPLALPLDYRQEPEYYEY
jgi:dUTPase